MHLSLARSRSLAPFLSLTISFRSLPLACCFRGERRTGSRVNNLSLPPSLPPSLTHTHSLSPPPLTPLALSHSLKE